MLSSLRHLLSMQSARIQLRRLKQSDFGHMRKLETDADTMKFTPARVPQTEEQTLKRLTTQIEQETHHEAPFGFWAAELIDTKEFVGWCMLMPTDMMYPEIGYMITKEFRGKGFASEVCKLLIDTAFKGDRVECISARTNLTNDISIRVLEKVGFKYSDVMTVPEKVLGGTVDLKVFFYRKNKN